MRYLRAGIVALLALSLLANWILVNKTLSRRMHVRINDKTYTKGDYYTWLERHYGPEVTARMVAYELVTQAAEKAHCKADPKELQELHDVMRDTNPQLAREWRLKPWVEADWMQDRERDMDLLNLTIKDVPATDDQVRQYFEQNPGRWDKPVRIYTKVVASATQTGAERAKLLMSRVQDMKTVGQQLAGQAVVQGVDGTWMFQRPYNGKFPVPWMAKIANLPVGAVDIEHPAQGQWIVVRVERKDPGKHVTFDEVKDKVARDFKLTHATPAKDELRKLWDQANIETEQPALKDAVENLLFPDRLDQGGR
ncbi:MAG: peptidyl-prolyl cis-trans isomerase [Chthonomonadales bacterium]